MTFVDVTEYVKDPIRTKGGGWWESRCDGASVSVGVQELHPADG